MLDDAQNNHVGFQAPASVDADLVWTLPATDGTNNQVLATDGSGNLGWVSVGGGGDFFANGSVAMTDQLELDGTSTAALPALTFNGVGRKVRGVNKIRACLKNFSKKLPLCEKKRRIPPLCS